MSSHTYTLARDPLPANPNPPPFPPPLHTHTHHHQVKLYGGYVRWHADVPPPDSTQPARAWLSLASLAYRRSRDAIHAGPVHLNLQFRDPLAPVLPDDDPHRSHVPASVLRGLTYWSRSGRPFSTPIVGEGAASLVVPVAKATPPTTVPVADLNLDLNLNRDLDLDLDPSCPKPTSPEGASPTFLSPEVQELLDAACGTQRGLIVASGLTDSDQVTTTTIDGNIVLVLLRPTNPNPNLVNPPPRNTPQVTAVAQLATALDWPIVADATSGLRVLGRDARRDHGHRSRNRNRNGNGNDGRASSSSSSSSSSSLEPLGPLPLVLRHLDHTLLGAPGSEVWRLLRPDMVIEVGSHLVSKRVAAFLEWAALAHETTTTTTTTTDPTNPSVVAAKDLDLTHTHISSTTNSNMDATWSSTPPMRWVKLYPYASRHDPAVVATHVMEMPARALVNALYAYREKKTLSSPPEVSPVRPPRVAAATTTTMTTTTTTTTFTPSTPSLISDAEEADAKLFSAPLALTPGGAFPSSTISQEDVATTSGRCHHRQRAFAELHARFDRRTGRALAVGLALIEAQERRTTTKVVAGPATMKNPNPNPDEDEPTTTTSSMDPKEVSSAARSRTSSR